uniref:SAM-dependent MTase TRM10-type domain-containing protein n=1 Tax=Rhabditophanes sp. KR3021 TaxID=114890 RepID=A0AC35TTL8_9BILA
MFSRLLKPRFYGGRNQLKMAVFSAEMSTGILDTTLPESVKPSLDVIESLLHPKQKEQFIILILYERSQKVPTSLSNTDWSNLLRYKSTEDKEGYLRHLWEEETGKKGTTHSKVLISSVNQAKLNDNEMVYARNFHQLIDCYGNDFRKRINLQYDSAYMEKIRLGESPLKVIVDCRYLYKLGVAYQQDFTKSIQKLWTDTWFDADPVNIHLCNFLVDDRLGILVRKNLKFLFEDKEQPLGESNVFKPTLTTQGLGKCGSKMGSDAVIISSKATQYLPEDLSPFDTFVIAAADENSLESSSLSISRESNLPMYKLPVEKHVKWQRGSKQLNPMIIGNIVRCIKSGKLSWADAINKFVPAYHVCGKERESANCGSNSRDTYKDKVQTKLILERVANQRVDTNALMDQSARPNLLGTRSKRIHKISREERNRAKKS